MKEKSLQFVGIDDAFLQNYFPRRFILVLSLVVLGATRRLLVDYKLRVAVLASVAVGGRFTAQMLWNGMNMILVVV
jgi:hypothetical protein